MDNEAQRERTERVYPVDAEHDSLRLVIAGAFVVSAVLGFLLLAAVVPSESVNLLAVLGGLVIAAGFSALVEQQLKARWPSGRAVVLGQNAVAVQKHERTLSEIELNGEAQLLRWHFEVTKRTRVPKGWYMVAAAVRNMPNDEYIAVYTLVSPQDYTEHSLQERFTALQKPSNVDEGSIRLAGEQRRLHTAENARWHEGCEMHYPDFMAFVGELEARFDA